MPEDYGFSWSKMKHLSLFILALMISIGAFAQMAHFTDFQYQGTDKLPEFNPATQYLNPIISGCAPDPSITRKGDDYYLANSTFCYFPGVPIWHSKDLINWDFVGYALDRTSQLEFRDNLPLQSGVYAPDIKYNPYNDTFYMITTLVGTKGDIVVKTKDPRKGWSEIIKIDVPGIDPSFYFTEDGKAYIVNNQSPIEGEKYNGHTAIGLREYDLATDKIIGEPLQIITMGVHPEDKPIWIEGPHLYKIDGKYYLMAAEGGTSDRHSEVVFVADQVKGPYSPCKTNPILTQRDLPKNRLNPISSTGHADLFQTQDGKWWSVFLGVAPFEYNDRVDYYNTGRQTFLVPASWENGQPVLLPQGKEVPWVCEKPNTGFNVDTKTQPTNNGNFLIHDTFTSLDPMWMQVRTPQSQWYRLAEGCMEVDARPISITEQKNPSFVCRWIKNVCFETSVTVDFTPKSQNDLAGLCLYQKETHNFVIGKTLDADGKTIVALYTTLKGKTTEVAKAVIPAIAKLQVKCVADKKDYKFYYSVNSGNSVISGNSGQWIQLGETQDGSILSTKRAGGFTGAVVGMYATCKK